MKNNIATLDDLQQIKNEIVEVKEVMKELSNLLAGLNLKPQNPMMRSSAVRDFLDCSQSKLESLIRCGDLIPVKIGGTNYFHRANVEQLYKSNINN